MKRFPYRTILLGILCLVAAAYFHFRGVRRTRPALGIASAAVKEHAGRSLFFNPEAQPILREARPDATNAAGGEAARFADATQDPELFRKLDRKLRFDTLLLAGDPAGFIGLLYHLLDTRDWKLVYLDDAILIFDRDAGRQWSETDLDLLNTRIESLPSKDRATLCATIANQLLAIRQPELSRIEVEKALAADSTSPAAWTQQARYEAQTKDWKEALKAADKALAYDGQFTPALMMKAQILAAMGKWKEAYPVSKHLWELAPEDPYVLFMHAKVAHGVRAYTEESEALNQLIALIEKSGRSVSRYRMYLGQCYMADGQGKPAIREFEAALKSGDLPADQQQFANESIRRIKDRLSL